MKQIIIKAKESLNMDYTNSFSVWDSWGFMGFFEDYLEAKKRADELIEGMVEYKGSIMYKSKVRLF